MKLIQIIKEYRRDITGQALGDKLIQRLANETDPEGLHDVWALSTMWLKPRVFGPHRYALKIGNDLITPNTEDAGEFVQKYKQQIIDQVLHFIENRDPTNHKEYTQWLARQWVADNVELEDLNRHNLIGKFDMLKRKNLLKPEQRDINRFKTYNDFENVVSAYELPDEQQREVDKGRANEVYQDNDVRVIVPHDERAACYYGQGTRWCTSGRENNMFNRYNNQGELFILLPKHPLHKGEKYQIHFPSGQFMDERDDSVNPMELLAERFPNLYDWFMDHRPNDITSSVMFLPDEQIEDLLDDVQKLALNYLNKIADDDTYDPIDIKVMRHTLSDITNVSPEHFKQQMGEYYDNTTVKNVPSFITSLLQMEWDQHGTSYDAGTFMFDYIHGLKAVRDEDGWWHIIDR
jgi:hypothetical protein